MNNFFRKTLIAVVAVAAMGGAAAQVKERTLKFAFQNQTGHPQAQGAQKFADLVAQKSGNKIQVKIYGGGAQALARQNLTVIGQSYELGRVTVFEVLAERRRYLDVERSYTEALRAAYEARTALNRALGEGR